MRLVALWDMDGKAPSGFERHIPIIWNEFEVRGDSYRFDKVDEVMAKLARPCHLDLIFYMNDAVDHTPGHHKRSLTVKNAAGRVGEVPPYGSQSWRDAYIEAIRALADRYRNDERVVSYWLALGVDQETAAAYAEFAESLRVQLKAQQYYDFLRATTEAAVAAWAPKPVFVQGAPAPGALWGYSGRAVIADLLRSGAGYKMNGLLIDQADSVGLGQSVGLGKYDMAADRRAFEPPDHGTGKSSMELYWRLLRAMHHKADFVALQDTWQLAGTAASMFLPRTPYWIVFRDLEYPPEMWGDYGVSGEPGDWGTLRVATPGARTFKATVGFERWTFTCTEPLVLCGVPDGPVRVEQIEDSGSASFTETVKGGRLTLPPGHYHRIDVHPQEPKPELDLATKLTQLESRVRELEQWQTRVRS